MNDPYRPYANLLSARDQKRIRREILRDMAGIGIILAIVVLMMLLAGTV